MQLWKFLLLMSTPTDWARSQSSIGRVLYHQAQACEAATSRKVLKQALETFRITLQVYTEEYSPTDWASIQHYIGTLFAI